MNFTPIDNNGTVDGFCLIKSLDKKTSSKGDTYLDMTLSDAGGEINAKLWRYNPAVHGEYEINEDHRANARPICNVIGFNCGVIHCAAPFKTRFTKSVNVRR